LGDSPDTAQELQNTLSTLQKLERTWSDCIQYGRPKASRDQTD
jgi:hypothetical protein